MFTRSRRIGLCLTALISLGWMHQLRAVPPGNHAPIILEAHSQRYNDVIYVWGEIKDPDHPEEDVVVTVSGDAGGTAIVYPGGIFALTFEGTGLPLPISLTVTATDPASASTTADASVTE